MPFKYVDDGHRVGMVEEVMSHAKQVFEQGLQLEAILLVHEYLEQRLNALYKESYGRDTIHRRFKQMIDTFRSQRLLTEGEYTVLNEFNRLRNVNANQILDFSLTLRGAKKGDMIKAMDLAVESEQIISKRYQEAEEKTSQQTGKNPLHS